MVTEEKLETKIHRTERKLVELSVHIQRLNREYQEIIDELALAPDELKNFAENPENFDPPIWEQLQQEKKQMDERLDLELNNVQDANKTKHTISERGKVQQHWLHVR